MSDSCCQKKIDVCALQAKQRRTLIIMLCDDDPMLPLLGHASLTASPSTLTRAARFTLQTLPAGDVAAPGADGPGKVAGFSPHAGVAAKAEQRDKLERLCRDISRPAVSEKRLCLLPNGHLRYRLKTPYPVCDRQDPAAARGLFLKTRAPPPSGLFD